MFGIPLSFIIICVIVSAWCALHDHLNGRLTPKIRAFNVVLEIVLFIYAVWSFGILTAIAIAVAFCYCRRIIWFLVGPVGAKKKMRIRMKILD